MQRRPCFLVVDPEHARSLSSRKLVLETAKYNVITAYSCEEAVSTLLRFPAVDALIVNGALLDTHALGLLEALGQTPDVKLIIVGDGRLSLGPRTPDAVIDNFSPPKLLEALQTLFPNQSSELLEHEEDLERGHR
ncbi:response regulator [Terriglobus aquaticus]|uniref:Response regulator n=1 Tax=Terriglobus aquaticus TaxID=940139 RepID=A0ABW9KHB6_9BACT|nr:response regulator [Terriglobus aquaticus]